MFVLFGVASAKRDMQERPRRIPTCAFALGSLWSWTACLKGCCCGGGVALRQASTVFQFETEPRTYLVDVHNQRTLPNLSGRHGRLVVVFCCSKMMYTRRSVISVIVWSF